MMPKSQAYISIAIAAIAAFVIGIIVPHVASGNDDNPVGYRTKVPTQQEINQVAPSPAPTPTFVATRMSGLARCFTSQPQCTVTLDILKSPSPGDCEIEANGTKPPTPCPLTSPCPTQASCLNFTGYYNVQHIRGKWLIWRIGDEAHTKDTLFLQGIVIVQ